MAEFLCTTLPDTMTMCKFGLSSIVSSYASSRSRLLDKFVASQRECSMSDRTEGNRFNRGLLDLWKMVQNLKSQAELHRMLS